MNNNGSGMGCGSLLFILVILLVMLGSCGSGSNSSYSSRSSRSSSGYSDLYNSSPSYRKNVDDVAGIYGMDSRSVDSVYGALAGKK